MTSLYPSFIIKGMKRTCYNCGAKVEGNCRNCRIQRWYKRSYFYVAGIKITWVKFEELVEECGGACSICSAVVALDIDHNHSTKEIRGLLCRPCNLGLGMFQDSVQRLEAAIQYLQEH